MRFAILGPVEVWHGDQKLPLGGVRQRFLLAALLLNACRLITTDTLIGMLWDEPPTTAKAQLHNLMCRLRRHLRYAPGLVDSYHGGYQLHLEPHELDLLDFRRLANQGQLDVADGDYPRGFPKLTAALSLWRGPALGDIGDKLAGGIRSALHEERLAVVEAKLSAELALGRYDQVLRDLPGLIADNPYRECLHEKRMLALAGAGRRADALAAYREMHRRFVDELGIEPGRRLQHLEQSILCDEATTSRHRLVSAGMPGH